MACIKSVFFTAFFNERRNWRLSVAISAIRQIPDYEAYGG